MSEHQYVQGDVVWLVETNPPEYCEHNPRQLAVILVCEEIHIKRDPETNEMHPDEMYIVEVDPIDKYDDGLRELQVRLIERRATDEEVAGWDHHRDPKATAYLEQAGPYIGLQEGPE